MVSTTHILGLVKFTIPKTDVVHPKSGLILHYLSEYRPANKIITFTVTLPMYSDMYYLIPNEAMGKITECQDKEANVREIRAIQEELQKSKTLFFVNLSRIVNTTTQPAVTLKSLQRKK